MITDRNSEDSTFRQIAQNFPTDLSSVRSSANDFEQQLQTFVRERPVAAVFAALGLGFVVARMFARR